MSLDDSPLVVGYSHAGVRGIPKPLDDFDLLQKKIDRIIEAINRLEGKIDGIYQAQPLAKKNPMRKDPTLF